MNEANLIGNLGRDPEIRATQKGTKVANFSVATTEGYGDKQKTEWHRIVAWDKSAEIAGKLLEKGTKVFIRGQLRTRKWQKDGKDVYSTEIHVGGWGSVITVLGNMKKKADGDTSSSGSGAGELVDDEEAPPF